MNKLSSQAVYLIDGSRTPFYQQNPKATYSKLDLGVIAARALLLKQPFSSLALDDVTIASSTPSDNADLAQLLSLRLQCNSSINPHTFSAGENCGLQALEYAHQQIASQEKSLILLGGIESSQPKPISLSLQLSEWIREWKTTSGITNKAKVFNKLHTRHFRTTPVEDLEKYNHELHLEIAEKTANYYSLSSEDMAEYVKLSQRRLKYAQRNHQINDIVPLFYPDGSSLHRDEGMIHSDPELLNQAILSGNPPTGLITHGSVTQSSEGACLLLLASAEAVQRYQLSPIAKLSSPVWARNDEAIQQLLNSNQQQAKNIDYWEWDETSAAEILSLEKKANYEPIEAFKSLNTVNIDGGSLALGSPNTANNLRCILQLAHILKRNNANHGVCHFSFATGLNSALLLDNIAGESA